MENLNISDNNISNIFRETLAILNINSSTIMKIVAYIILFIAIKLIFKYIKKPIKYYLYTKRVSSYYRFLYYRIDKIFKPILYLIYLLFIKKTIFTLSIFNNTILTDVIFIIELMLILWISYEVIKYIIYATIRDKIKSQKMARRELFNLLLNIFKIVIVFIAIIAILAKFGVDVTALITSLGIGGVIIGFSARDTLVNFFDSIRLVAEDAFRQGDWIETKEIEGFVVELGLTSTKIRTFDNALVTVPNSKLANDYLKNWSKRLIGRRIKFHLPIKYTTNTKEIDRVIYEIYEMLHSHPDIVNLNKVRYLKKMDQIYENGLFNIEDMYGVRRTLLVYLDDIGKYSLNILIYAFSISVNWEDWLRVKQDVIKKIIEIIDNSELEFAYPKQEVIIEPPKIE